MRHAVVIFFLVATGYVAPVLADDIDRFARCISRSGAKYYGTWWCPYCKKLQPGLERLSVEYRDRDLVLLGISFSEDDGAQPQKTLDARGHTFKTLVLGDAVAQDYGVKGTPTTFFIDREGTIKAVTHTSDPDDPILRSSAELTIGR